MGECAYAAVTDQLLSLRGRPGRLPGAGVSGAVVVLDPLRIDLARNLPVSRVSANSCCFLSQALDALAVHGVRPSEIQAPYDPNRRGPLRPIRALKKCQELRFFYGFFRPLSCSFAFAATPRQ
jgi:hypothetical protein